MKQTICSTQQEFITEATECRKVEGVQHECMAECLDYREELQTDGTAFIYEIYPMLGWTFDTVVRKRCQSSEYYPEDYLWLTLKRLISLHALLQSKVQST